MPTLILVRHGQTDYNAQRRYQGQIDIPLNAVGLEQAQALNRRLANLTFEGVYSSDLGRALHTTQIALADHPAEKLIKTLPSLREVSGGKCEGMTREEMTAHYPEEVKLWEHDRMHHALPEGETTLQVLERVKQSLAVITEAHPGKKERVLVVTHGGVINTMLSYLMDLNPNYLWRWQTTNCSLTVIEVYKDGGVMWLFNDTTHLPQPHETSLR